MRGKYYYTLLILLMIISACKKDNPPQAFTESSYPLAVGNQWQYQLTDLIGGGIDTITLKVISVNKSGPYIRFECNFIYNDNVTDSGYFLQSDTSLSFVVSNSYSVSCFNFHLKFPVSAGQYWAGSFPGDSILVDAVVPTYSAYGHTYSPCYYTSERYNLPDNRKVEQMILTPKIGLIEQNINFNSDTAGKTATYPGGIQIQQSILLLNYYVQ